MKKDIFQERYKKGQERKKAQLVTLLDNRSSQRVFNGESITDSEFDFLLENMAKVPSSCSREAIYATTAQDRTKKELLGALLVGGVGWIHRADKIILLFADPLAYKAGDEIKFMPYLDAGAVLATAYLLCEEMGIGCCFVNPNIREENKKIFHERFRTTGIFCGALAIGRYDKKAKPTKKKPIITLK
jgi:nitroreductase